MDEDQSEGAGPESASAALPWVERMLGRSLGDVRVHDSTQAGELASRLGARAFAAGRHVYVRPELLRPMTPRGAALLAHEVTHAVEHTGGAPLPGPAPRAGGSPAVQRAIEGGQDPAETRAEHVEAQALGAQKQGGRASASAGGSADPEAVADRVYDRIVRELQLDRDRAAHNW